MTKQQEREQQQIESLRQRLQTRMAFEGYLRDVSKVDRMTRGLRKRVALQSAGITKGNQNG